MQVKVNGIYRHRTKGTRYLVTNTRVLLKCPDTGAWVDAINYTDFVVSYTRTRESFETRFEPMPVKI